MSTAPASTLLDLIPHPTITAPKGVAVRALCQRQGASLSLEYRIRGELARLCIPDHGPQNRKDGLWRTTCLEAFIRQPGESRYREYNFSPNGAWACYAFSEYRGAAQSPDCEAPDIQCCMTDNELLLDVRLADIATGPLQLGLSAVVEDLAGQLSYWALHHPAEKPDFHDAAGFVLTLE